MQTHFHVKANTVELSLGCVEVGHFEPLSLNKFFDPSTPSMRKGRDGGEKMKNEMKKKIKTFLVATNIVASRPTGTPTTRAKIRTVNFGPVNTSLNMKMFFENLAVISIDILWI